jgi:hypothetical protein
VKANPVAPGSSLRCDEHPDLPAKYELQILAFGHVIVRRRTCENCLCRHFNLQVYFSVKEGMRLPKGLTHR